MTPSDRPRFSVVTAAYNVGVYLPDFIKSLEEQTYGFANIEVIAVDDGSTDASSTILEAWLQRHPDNVVVVTQENAGQGAARTAGLDRARGQWVTFPDPDDVLEPDYFEVVARFLDDNPETELVATHRLIWMEEAGEVTNSHPLRAFFRGDRLVDLDVVGDHFHGSAPATFFRLDEIRAKNHRFDNRLPVFEDGHFTSRYLLEAPSRRVGFLASARYHYRKRAAANSTLSNSRSKPGRYGDVIEFGYLDLVDRAIAQFGAVPRWLKSYLAYEIAGFFAVPDSRVSGRLPFDDPELVERFHRLAALVVDRSGLVDAWHNGLVRLPTLAYPVVAHSYANDPWHQSYAVVETFDDKQRLAQISYYFTGERPTEQFLTDGEELTPLHAKDRSFVFGARILLRQRLAWVPANRNLALTLNGRAVPILLERPEAHRLALPAGAIARRWRRNQREAGVLPRPQATPMSADGQRAAKLLAKGKYADEFSNAWVCMDRIYDAGDSGETFFKYLRTQRPRINAWFVLQKDTHDWKRLRTEGFGDRLIEHGSLRWRLLMANAIHLISSHADLAITNPEAISEFTQPAWQFTFLQHGVIKDDLSHWLDKRPIDTFVTSTPREFASIAGDDTNYRYTTHEVHLTGLPRFDRLREIGLAYPPEKRDLLLLTPTWRRSLSPTLKAGTQERLYDMHAVRDSEFVSQWWALLRNPALHAAAADHGLSIALLPHPNLQAVMPSLEIPAGVQLLTYDTDVQQLFARARVLVTDFSSIAFNAAYLERPLVYFQFDRDAVLGGEHTGRQDYFDYDRDGFGPVAFTPDDAATAIVDVLAAGASPAEPYRTRIAETFPVRDGQCCERVFEAIRASTRSQLGAVPTPTPRG